jgi:hypothetical protein
VFAGMQLTDDLTADVTFDLTVLAPDGTVYDKMELKGIEAFKARTPTRFRVFDNRSVVKLRFEPRDKLGEYKFLAEVRDNVGESKLSLVKEIQLTQ